MRNNNMVLRASNWSKSVLVLSLMFVLSVAAPAVLAGKGGGESPTRVVILDTTVNGTVVMVKVKNLSHESLTVFVEVDAIVDGLKVRGLTPVSVFAGSTAGTTVGFTGPVSSVEGSGIIEPI
jgi:hypothetical protein